MIIAALLAGLQVLSASGGDSVRAIVLRAEAAVSGDSAPAAVAFWRARVAHDSTDRAARLGLEVIANLLADTAQAVRWANSLAPPNRPITDRFAARAAFDRVTVQSLGTNVTAVADALASVAHSARAIGDSATAAEALTTLSIWRAHQRGPIFALALLDSARAIIPKEDVRLLALWRCRRAELLAASGRGSAAEEAQKGATLAHSIGEAREEGMCLAVIGEGEIGRGRMSSAIPLLRRSRDLERKARNRITLAGTLQWLGYAELRNDELASARRDLSAAIAVGDSIGYGSAVAWSWFGLADLSLELGDLIASSASLSKADSLFAKEGDHLAMARTREMRATIARIAGRDDEARAAYDSILAGATVSGDLDLASDARLARAQLALGRSDLAGAHSELAAYRILAHKRGDVEAAGGRTYEFAELALAEAHFAEAESLFRGLLARLNTQDYRGRYAAGAGLAQLYLKRGEPERAAQTLDTAARALDAWRATLDDRALRVQAYQEQTFFGPEERGVPEVIAELAAAGQLEVAFRVAERRRARELSDALVRARVAATDEMSPRAPLIAPLLADLSATRAAIPDDATAIIEYVAGGRAQATSAFVITRAAARAVSLGRLATLAQDVSLFSSLLESGTSARVVGARLEGELLEPVIAMLPASTRRLVIVADGAILHLPFDAMTMPDGRFVVERFAVSEIPSAAVAIQLWSAPRRAPASTLLVFGDPLYTASQGVRMATGDVYGDAFAANGGLARLPASAREARNVARYATSSLVLLGADASEARLKRAPLARYGIVHFATHALFDESSATRAALALASGGGENGFVGPDELAALRFDADLVVLSGCRTAAGLELRGEGLQGLTAPLLAAGVRSIVATRWPVSDRGASKMMNDFYAEVARGYSVSDAMQRIKQRALAAGTKPSDWAAYTVLGDPMSKPALTTPSILSRLIASIEDW